MKGKKSILISKDGIIQEVPLEHKTKQTKKKYSKLNQNVKPKRKAQKMIKGLLKKAFEVTMAFGVGILVFKGSAYIDAQVKGSLDFEEPSYVLNQNTKPGYYNENPITICISNDFSDFAKKQIASGIKYLDENAKGLKFEYFYGDPTLFNCDIKINREDFGKGGLAGQATLGRPDAVKIQGQVYLEENLDTILFIKSVAVHEICHVIGLEHSKDINSIMFPTLSTLTMSKQDIENLNKMYPEQEYEK